MYFLRSNRDDVRALAAKNVQDLTGTHDGRVALLGATSVGDKDDGVCKLLCKLLGDVKGVAKVATGALVNLSSEPSTLPKMVSSKILWSCLLEALLSETCENRDESFMLLANITTSSDGASRLLKGRTNNAEVGFIDLLRLLEAFLKNPDDDSYQHMASVLTNATSVEEGRNLLLERAEALVLLRIMKQLRSKNVVRRRGCAAAIRNCLFCVDYHAQVLGMPGFVEGLLRPLLGEEEIDVEGVDDKESKDYSAELSALLRSHNREREPDAAVRRLVVESLMLLAGSKKGRDALKARKAYEVVKVYHLTEDNEDTSNEVFKLVDLLLGDDVSDEHGDAWDEELMKHLGKEKKKKAEKEAESEEVLFQVD